MKNDRYHYTILKPDEKKIYRWIYEALGRRDEKIKVPKLVDKERIAEIFWMVLLDEPMLYYVNPQKLISRDQLGLYILLPFYLYTWTEIEKLNRDIWNKVTKIYQRAISKSTDEFALELFYHNSVAYNVAYDYDYLMKQDDYMLHSIVGVFINKQAVCDGISKAFKLLCNMSDIKCMVVVGDADGKGDFEKASAHAWNMVKIKGESYYVDVTWDAITLDDKTYIRYDYFNVTAEQFSKTHYLEKNLPLCTATDLNYFYYTGNIISSLKEMKKLIAKEITKPLFMFLVRKEDSDFSTVQQIYESIAEAINAVSMIHKYGREYCFFVNEIYWTVMVVAKSVKYNYKI